MNKQELSKALDQLIADADEQTQIYEGGLQRLYLNLAGIYLWWREANKIDGYLTELYESKALYMRGEEENFTRVIRLVWDLDWKDRAAPKLQSWSNALRAIHQELKTNKDAYEVNPQDRIRQFIDSHGGITGIGKKVSPYQTEDAPESTSQNGKQKKTKSDEQSETALRNKHIELGEVYFANDAESISHVNVKNKSLDVTRKNYAVALIRKNASGAFDILSVSNNEDLVKSTIVETYRRNDSSVPLILRMLTETIETQSLPISIEKHRSILADVSDVVGDDGRTKLKRIKRLLLRPKTKDILLSESRSECSVVTIVTPHKFPTNINEDTILRSVNHKFIERSMIQSRDLCFHSTLTSKIETVADENLKASHVLRTKNTVTDKIHSLYFYRLSEQTEASQTQADINKEMFTAPTWMADVDKVWLHALNSICVSNWLRTHGPQINRDKNKQVAVDLGKSVAFHFSGTRGHYTEHELSIPKPKVVPRSKNISLTMRTKDIFPVLSSLASQDIQGTLRIAANEHVMSFTYKTPTASYFIAVPTCDDRGRLDTTAFKHYEV